MRRGRSGIDFVADPDVVDTCGHVVADAAVRRRWPIAASARRRRPLGLDKHCSASIYPFDLYVHRGATSSAPGSSPRWSALVLRARRRGRGRHARDTATRSSDPDREKIGQVQGQGERQTPTSSRGQRRRRMRCWGASGRPRRRRRLRHSSRRSAPSWPFKVLNVSKFVLGVMGDAAPGSTAAVHRAARPRRCCTRSRRPVQDAHRRVRRLRLRPRAGARRALLLGLLRRLRRAGEAPRVRRRRRSAARSRRGPRSATALSVLQRLFAPFLVVRDRGSVVVVAGRGSIHRTVVARRRRRSPPAATRSCSRSRRDVLRRDPQGEVGGRSVSMRAAGRRAPSCTDTRGTARARSTPAAARRARTRASSTSSILEAGDEFSVDGRRSPPPDS